MSNNYVQAGIPGVAQDKPFRRGAKLPVYRPHLLDYIENKLKVGKEFFANLVGVTPATVTNWLHNPKAPSPSLFKCQQMAHELGLTLEEIAHLFEVVK